MNFKLGEIVEHILDKEWVIVLEDLGDTIKCRTKSFQIIEFYKFEIRKR